MKEKWEIGKECFSRELSHMIQNIHMDKLLYEARGEAWADDVPKAEKRKETVKAWKDAIDACKTYRELVSVLERAEFASEKDMCDEGAARIVELCYYRGVFDRENW